MTTSVHRDSVESDLALAAASYCEEGELLVLPSDREANQIPDQITIRCQSLPVEILLQVIYTLEEADKSQCALHFTITNSSHDLPRTLQARLQTECEAYVESIRGSPEFDTPVYSVAIWLSAFLADHRDLFEVPADQPDPPLSNVQKPSRPQSITIKRVLIWSHHLLAISKRKDIVAWSSELSLCGLSKPGYPGIIVVEGQIDDVDEFVARIKRLQWQALQVRCEETEDIPIQDESQDIVDLARKSAKLYKKEDAKPIVHEVETLGDVAARLKGAGLESLFLSAMKLHN